MSLVEDIHHEGGSSCISLGGYDRWKGVSGVDNRLDDDLPACLLEAPTQLNDETAHQENETKQNADQSTRRTREPSDLKYCSIPPVNPSLALERCRSPLGSYFNLTEPVTQPGTGTSELVEMNKQAKTKPKIASVIRYERDPLDERRGVAVPERLEGVCSEGAYSR